MSEKILIENIKELFISDMNMIYSDWVLPNSDQEKQMIQIWLVGMVSGRLTRDPLDHILLLLENFLKEIFVNPNWQVDDSWRPVKFRQSHFKFYPKPSNN